jgi:hypothetical protein
VALEEEKLSLAGVADTIMLEFCRSVGGLEKGSPYIEKAFREAGLNLYDPTGEQIEKAIANLAAIETELFGEAKALENRENRLEMLKKANTIT